MAGPPPGTSFGYIVGSIFIFNLIVGTGSLALPLGWNEAGLASGLSLTVLIAFLAYICVTYIIEIQSYASAVLENQKNVEAASLNSESTSLNRDIDQKKASDISSVIEPTYSYFEDEGGKTAFYPKQVELGTMAEVFLGKGGKIFFYVILLIYLYGDLVIYAVAVPQSVLKTLSPDGITIGSLHIEYYFCYWAYLLIFSMIVVPFSFFTFTNTKYLQYFTICCRNLAFGLMIIIALALIFQGEGATAEQLNYFEAKGLAGFWGTAIYCFMCHHSVPGLISPLQKKRKVNLVMFVVYCGVLTFYMVLSSTAVWAFGNTAELSATCTDTFPCQIQSMYTYNFLSYKFKVVGYYLGLFPVFTLTSNFPLIAITLRNNMMKMVSFGENWNPRKRQYVFSLLTTIPSLMLAAVFTDVSKLVAFTGSYAGLFIEFVIPAFLVYSSRKYVKTHFPGEENPYSSPFKHTFWIVCILVVAAVSLVIVTINNAVDIYHGIESLIDHFQS